MDNMSDEELIEAMGHKVGLAAECISPDNGETWFCDDCEHDCPAVTTIKLNEFHSYSYKDSGGTVITIPLKPKPKPKPYVKPYEHKYVAMDDAEFMPIGSAIVSHRGEDDIQYLVRMGPPKPKQPDPENCEFGEDELRYEALEWVDEMLDVVFTTMRYDRAPNRHELGVVHRHVFVFVGLYVGLGLRLWF
jgi:hypothetical protein